MKLDSAADDIFCRKGMDGASLVFHEEMMMERSIESVCGHIQPQIYTLDLFCIYFLINI